VNINGLIWIHDLQAKWAPLNINAIFSPILCSRKKAFSGPAGNQCNGCTLGLMTVGRADGRKSWVKETNLPKKVQEEIKMKGEYMQRELPHNEFGQKRVELTFMEKQDGSTANDQSPVYSMQK